MKNIAKTTAILSLTAMTLTANAETDKIAESTHKEATTEQVNFASEIITTNTHDKILAITNTQIPAKLETLSSGSEKPFTPEQLEKIKNVKDSISILRTAVAQSTGADKITAQAALDKYRAEDANFVTVYKWYKEATKSLNYEKNRKFEKHDKRHGRDETIDATVGVDVSNSIDDEFVLEDRIAQIEFAEKRIGLTALNVETGEFIELPEIVKKGMEKLGINIESYDERMIVRKLTGNDSEVVELSNIKAIRKIAEAQISTTKNGIIILEIKRKGKTEFGKEKYFNRDGDIINTSSSSQTITLIKKEEFISMN